MELKKILLLFEVVNGNGNIQKLQREGLDYSEIGNLIEFAAKNGYITKDDENRLSLTTQGKQMFSELKKEFNRHDKKTWIEPEIESKILPIDRNSIFLPKQNELYFDN